MPSYSHASRQQRGGGMSTATLLGAKVAVASAALAAAASLARLAVPHLVSLAGAVFPRAWAVARFWLAPPYLFVTVHLIILVIWKLSADHKHHFHQAAAQPHHHKQDNPSWPAVALDDDVAPAVVKANNNKEEEVSPDSGGGDSCVTTESDEDASSAPSSYDYSSAELARRSVVVVEPPVPQVQQRAVLEREVSLPSSQTVECDDDLDATWNAIMQKTRSAQEPPPRARDPSVGAEEMNRRFDDFIKKKRNSFGRQ